MELVENKMKASYFQNEVITSDMFNEAVDGRLDYTDMDTLNTVCSINEADRAAVLTSLTSKLYDSIVDKVDEIDFGSIATSKGDITKIENYEQLLDTIQVLRQIITEYHQDTAPVDTVIDAIANIRNMKAIWVKGYQMNLSLPIITYQSMTMACVSSISLLIATSIEFIKNTSDEEFKISLDRTAYNRTKDNLLYSNLKKFNESCKDGSMEKIMQYTISTKTKNFSGAGIVAGGTSVVFLIIKVLIPMIRECIYFFYHARQSASDYFAVQADLLQVNANNLQYSTDISDEDKAVIFNKQNGIADKFRKFSNVLSIKFKKAENDTHKKIKSDDSHKYKISDLTDEKLDSADLGDAQGHSGLF